MPKSHPTYDSAFRQGAADLVLRSGRPLKRMAADLGISANSLRSWRDLAPGKGRGAPAQAAQPPGQSVSPFADPAAEIRRLQRENEYLRRQREILKRAMSILSEDPTSGRR